MNCHLSFYLQVENKKARNEQVMFRTCLGGFTGLPVSHDYYGAIC